MNSHCRFPSSRSGQFVWSSLLRQWPPFAFQLGKVSSGIHQIRRRCHACSVLTLRAYHVTCGSQSIVLQVRGKNEVTRHCVKNHKIFLPLNFTWNQLWHILSCKNQPFWQFHKRKKKEFVLRLLLREQFCPKWDFVAEKSRAGPDKWEFLAENSRAEPDTWEFLAEKSRAVPDK